MKETWETLQQEVEAAEHMLSSLKQRLTVVVQAEQEQADLYTQQSNLGVQLLKTDILTEKESITQCLQEITDRLAELEVTIESRLFSWGSLKEPFWLMVRFTGLGIILGALLQRWAGC